MNNSFSPIDNLDLANRLPPQNIDAEKSVLGSLMLDKNAIIKVTDILADGDFYKENHNAIYHTMLELYEKGEPIDSLSVTNRLRGANKLEKIGGVSYLTELVSTIPTAAHVAYYAKIIHQKRILRDLIEASYHISQLGYQENEEVDNLLDKAEQSIFNISQKSLTQEFAPIKSTLEEAFDRLDNLHNGQGALRGVPTGFMDLDNLLSGMQRSDLIILAARPSLGKTSLALDIARHVAKEKIPVGIFSLEMSRHDIVDRVLAAEAGISLYNLRRGHLSADGEDNDFVRFQEAIAELSETPLFINDAGSPNILQIRTMARRLQSNSGLGLLVVDYLQLIQPTNSHDSEVRQVTEISRSLKSLAKELNVPILALSQLSRAPEIRPDQRPRLSDLRSSGSIEQDADVVMFIYREDRTKKEEGQKQTNAKPNVADILVEKHRNGPTGSVKLYFHPEHVSFKNFEKHTIAPPENEWLPPM